MKLQGKICHCKHNCLNIWNHLYLANVTGIALHLIIALVIVL